MKYLQVVSYIFCYIKFIAIIPLNMQGTKRTELSEKIEQARKNNVSLSSVIDGMKTKRDKTLSDIDRFQLGIDVSEGGSLH